MAAYAPYKYNPAEMPVDEMKATFVGRQGILDRLRRAVQEQAESDSIHHYLLLGPRGIGKTTLLLMLQRTIQSDPDLSSRWLAVRYREEEFYVYTLRDLLALALEYLRDEEGVTEAGAVLDAAEAEGDDERSLAMIADALRKISQSHGKRILLLVDNFDLVFPKGNAAAVGQRAFRKLLTTESFLMVIGSSVLLFEDIAAYDQAFFNFFSPVHLENLSDEDIQELLLARARADENQEFLRGYRQHKEKVRAITYLTGGNPRLVLMLYEILSAREFLPVVQTLRETVDNLTPLLKDVLEDLPRQQSKALDALMRLGAVASPSEIAKRARLPLNAVTTQLGRLRQTGLVEGEGDGRGRPATYRVRDQMFRTWYQMRYLRPARRRVEMFVEFLRAWFSVEDRLTEPGELWEERQKQINVAGKSNRADEAARWMARLAELEPEDTPAETRLEARIRIVVDAARAHSFDLASGLLEAAVKSDGSELASKLRFLAPALQFAQTGDESALTKLPDEERQMAKRIAAELHPNGE